jgi:hypothetical protein
MFYRINTGLSIGKKYLVWGIAFLVLTMLLIPGCEKKVAVFQLSDLSINSSQIVGGDDVNVGVSVTNIGTSEGSTTISFILDDIYIGEQSVTLASGTSQNVSIVAKQDQPGEHTFSVSIPELPPEQMPKAIITPAVTKLNQSFKVLKPAAFTLSDLKLSQIKIEPGANVTVSADLSNTGEVIGEYLVTLKMDGKEVDSKNISLEGERNQNIDFTLNSDVPGSHEVAVDDLTQSFTILKPAEFKTSTLTLSPESVTASWSSTITVDVTNIGEIKGDYDVTLKVNSIDFETKTVSLEGGAFDTVSFLVLKDVGGNYSIRVDDLLDILSVQDGVLPIYHVGDQWVYRETDDGTVYTNTQTVIGEELYNGIECYVIKIEYAPKYKGFFSEVTAWVNKATNDPVMMQMTVDISGITMNETDIYTYSLYSLFDKFWPLKVGNEVTKPCSVQVVIEGAGQSSTETYNGTRTFKIDKIETIKVNAGEFRCFKMLVSEDGEVVEEQWYSDKTQNTVKVASKDGKHAIELLSYSIQGN